MRSSIGTTRTEVEFADHIGPTIADDPQGSWTFVADHLNTHVSATLVERVAAWCGIDTDLGIKGKEGVLATHTLVGLSQDTPTRSCQFAGYLAAWRRRTARSGGGAKRPWQVQFGLQGGS
jgi:hypothetical protein